MRVSGILLYWGGGGGGVFNCYPKLPQIIGKTFIFFNSFIQKITMFSTSLELILILCVLRMKPNKGAPTARLGDLNAP